MSAMSTCNTPAALEVAPKLSFWDSLDSTNTKKTEQNTLPKTQKKLQLTDSVKDQVGSPNGFLSGSNKENHTPGGNSSASKLALATGIKKETEGDGYEINFGPKLIRAPERRKPSSCVFVASLPALLLDDELCRLVLDHFQVFGEVASVKVLRDPLNRPYAFVQYTNDADCRTAIELGHNSELGGRRLRCEAAKVNRTLFFSFEAPVNRSSIVSLISAYGDTDMISPGTTSGRFIGDRLVVTSHNWFVKFAYRDEAIQAFASLSDSELFQVEWAQNVDDKPVLHSNFDKSSVFVGQLPPEVSEEQLSRHFSAHGKVNNISIVRRTESTFAFITFCDDFAAASAVARDNHSLFMNKTIHVKYKLSAPKKTSRVILSPRVPVALAPPPIHLRNRYTSNYSKWLSRVSIKSRTDELPSPRSDAVNSQRLKLKPQPASRFYIIPKSD